MSEAIIDAADALRALERFVVENDDLLELEERIGRFNIFDALRIARTEIRHSNFLAWLLDPNESHGLGSLFLRAVVMDLLSQMPQDRRPLSPVDLDGAELHGVEIRREWRHIDILITCERPRFVIAIENKVDSGEGRNQLAKYEETIRKEFAEVAQPIFVFLTREGDEASDEDWVSYSYADLHRVLSRCQRTNAGSIGDDVNAFLEHYLRLIGSRFMDDPKIDELCRKIYQNHRQALDLIFENVGPATGNLVPKLEELVLEHSTTWLVCNRTSKRLEFTPKEWLNWLPAISSRAMSDKRHWIRFVFYCGRSKCYLWCLIGPTTNLQMRRAVIERLISNPREFGFKMMLKKISDRWTRVYSERIDTWEEDEEIDVDRAVGRAAKLLSSLQPIIPAIRDALLPIVQTSSFTADPSR